MNQVFYPAEDVELIRSGKTLFEGTLLLADISGFTAITDALYRQGREGAEELTSLLNSCFNTMLTEIVHRGGTVLTFSGDSIVARFSHSASASVCARTLVDSMQIYRRTVIFNTRYTIGVKVVAGSGTWSQHIIGDRKRAHIIPAGGLVQEIASREETAERGDVVEFTSSALPDTTEYLTPDSDSEAFISPGAARAHGEYRPVTPVFIRVSGKDGSSLSPAALQEAYLSISRTVLRHGGIMHHVDQFTKHGTGIFALFGAPVSSGNDVLNGVKAALEAVDAVSGAELRCGMDTGFAYSGTVGNRTRKHYTVIGDPVNTAARLSETALPGSVTVTEAVTFATRSEIRYFDRRELILKGKPEPARTASAMGFLEAPGSIQPAGRDNEIELLMKMIDSGRTAVISGPAGMGKTTILNGLETRLAGLGYRVLRTGNTHQGDSLEALSGLLRRICSIAPESSKSQIGEALKRAFSKAGIPHLMRRLVFPGRMLLGLDIEDETFQGLPPKLRMENLLDSMIILLGSLSGRSCIMVEDLHYSGPGERELLTSLISSVSREFPDRISFVVTSRPEGLENFSPGADPLNLEGLSRQGSAEVMYECTGGDQLAPDLAELLYTRSQGNPFYLTQLFRYLQEKELIVKKKDIWEKKGSEDLTGLPESVFSMIMARIDRLAESTRESLKVASVVGMRFTEPLLNRLVQRNVHPDMSESLKAGLTCINSYAELEHIFSHMLIRDVTYDSILTERKRNLHREIAGILEENEGMRKGRGTAVLAAHFTSGEVWDRAALYHHLAGRHASEEYRNAEAMDHYLQAIELLEEHFPEERQQLADYIFSTAGLQDRIGDYQQARENYRRVVALSENMELTAKALMGIADILFNTGSMDDGLNLMTEVENLIPLTGTGAPLLELKVAAFRAWTYCVTGKVDAAEAEAMKSVEIGRNLENVSPYEKATKLGHALNTMATVYWARSRLDKSLELYEQAVDLAVENGLKREAAVTWGNIGLVLEKQGRYNEAVQGMQKQLRMATEIGEKLLILSAHGSLGMTRAVLGDFESAKENTARQLELARNLNVPHDHMLALNHMAHLEMLHGDLDQAVKLASQAIRMAQEHSMDRERVHGLSILGETALLRDDTEEAGEYISEALELARKVGSHGMALQNLLLTCRLCTQRNEIPEAESNLVQAEELAKGLKMILGEADCLTARAALLKARGRFGSAETVCREAVLRYRELGTRYNLAEALKLLSSILEAAGKSASAESHREEACGLYREMGLLNSSS